MKKLSAGKKILVGVAIVVGAIFFLWVALPFAAFTLWFVFVHSQPVEYSEIPRNEYVGVYAIDMTYETRMRDSAISKEGAEKMRLVLYANGEAKIIDVPIVYWHDEKSDDWVHGMKNTFSGAWETVYKDGENRLKFISTVEANLNWREWGTTARKVTDRHESFGRYTFTNERIALWNNLAGWRFEKISTDTSGYDDAAPELSDEEKKRLYSYFSHRPNHPMHAKHKALEEDVPLPIRE